MKKVIIGLFLVFSTLFFTGCESITEEDATVLLSDTLDSLKGSETTVFEVITEDVDKLVVVNSEEYYDTLILQYDTENYDYRYIRYLPVRENSDGEQLYYSLYFECVETPTCTKEYPTTSEMNSYSDEDLFLNGERSDYIYIKGQDNHFDFFKFLDVAEGVIEYAVRDSEDNIVLNDLSETTFSGILLDETITVDTFTFTINVDLEQLLLNDPEVFMAMYWLTDVSGLDMTGVEQEITLEVERDTNKLISFSMDQSFSNMSDTSMIPFANDFEITINLFKNGTSAIDYIATKPELTPVEVNID